MWDPQYAQQMISQDDANNCTTLAAIVLGVPNPFKLSDAEFEQVKAKLIEQKKLLLTYYAGFEDGVRIFAESDVKLMYSMGEPQVPMLKDKGIKAAMTIPKEGAIGWLDCWVVSAGARTSSSPPPGSTPASTRRSVPTSPTSSNTATPPTRPPTPATASPMATS